MKTKISEMYRTWIKFSKDLAGGFIISFVFLLTARVESDNPNDGTTLFWKVTKSVTVCIILLGFWSIAFLLASFICASTLNWLISWFTMPYGGLLLLPFPLVVVLWSFVPCLWYSMCIGIETLADREYNRECE